VVLTQLSGSDTKQQTAAANAKLCVRFCYQRCLLYVFWLAIMLALTTIITLCMQETLMAAVSGDAPELTRLVDVVLPALDTSCLPEPHLLLELATLCQGGGSNDNGGGSGTQAVPAAAAAAMAAVVPALYRLALKQLVVAPQPDRVMIVQVGDCTAVPSELYRSMRTSHKQPQACLRH
jgi:hypothetical protein